MDRVKSSSQTRYLLSLARVVFGGIGVTLRSRRKSLEIRRLRMTVALKPSVQHWADTASICSRIAPIPDRLCPEAVATEPTR